MFTILKMLRKRTQDPGQAAVAMLGIRPGDRVVVLGAGRPDLAAAIGAVTGLNGQTTTIAPDAEAESAIDRAAARAGALVEVVRAPAPTLPLDAQTMDVAVLPVGLAGLGAEGPSVLAEAIRVVRPGGRISICEPLPRPGLFGLAHTGPVVNTATVITRLTAAGLRAARHLGDLEGTAYFEAARPR